MNRLPHSIALLALLTLAAFAASADTMPPERQREILRKAIGAFDEAAEQSVSHPEQAKDLYREAAAGFTALTDAGIHNAALEYNLGNTYFRLGDLGQAILHYRRAAQIDPADPDLRANLDYARRQVEPAIERAGERRLWRNLLFWHFNSAPHRRFLVAALFSGLGWLLLLLRLRWPIRTLTAVGVCAVIIGLAAGTSVYWQSRTAEQTPPAVVVGEPIVLRLGRGEASDPALAQPLGPGVELQILETRGDWVQVRLLNDQTGWLPTAAIERI